MLMNAVAKIARKGIAPVVLGAVLVIGGVAGAASAAPAWAGNGRQSAGPASQVGTAAQECVIDAQPLADADLVLSLEGYGAQGALVDNDLTIVDMLTYAIQDEYLAHGEYEAIIAEYGAIRPYTNIVKSEENHIAALTKLFDAYGIAVPADDSADHLILPASLLEAAETGVQAEIDNIAMYDLFLQHELPDGVSNVFESLHDASENHLAAYERQVDRLTR